MKTLKTIAVLLAATAALSACSTTSTSVSRDGTADKLEWPDPTSTTFNKDRGTFPNMDS